MLRQTLRRTSPTIAAVLALAGAVALATACGSDEPTMGERMEDAADSAADELESVGDKMEEAGEEVRDEVDDHTS